MLKCSLLCSGFTTVCPAGQVAGFDFQSVVSCQDETDNSCPSEGLFGGYKLGCDGGVIRTLCIWHLNKTNFCAVYCGHHKSV